MPLLQRENYAPGQDLHPLPQRHSRSKASPKNANSASPKCEASKRRLGGCKIGIGIFIVLPLLVLLTVLILAILGVTRLA